MPRTLTAGMTTAVAAERSTIVHLLELQSSGGTTRLATAPQDIAWNGQTWQAIGGHMLIGAVEESADPDRQGLQLELADVDQTIISVVLNNQVRGREVRVWRTHLDTNAAIVADPLEIFRGFQNEAYEINENRDSESGTVTVSTRVLSRLVELNEVRSVATNLISHREMLARAGLAVTDTFFRHVPSLVNKQVFWGIDNPAPWWRRRNPGGQ